MTRPVRVLLFVGACISLLAMALAAAAALWLTSWIPTNGKAWLEAELEGQGPLDVRIGRLRYAPWEGLRLGDVEVHDRRTQARWVHAPSIRMDIGLLPLATRRVVEFDVAADLEEPARATVTLEGRYGLRDRRGVAELSTEALPLDTLSASLKARLRGLESGLTRLVIRAAWQPEASPEISGRLSVANLVWRLEGVPGPHTMEEVSGSFRLSGDVLTIEQLQGRSAGAAWEMEGTLGPLEAPSLDVRGQAQLELSTLARWLPQSQAWRPEGALRTVLIARGPLSRWPFIELMADTDITGASLSAPGFPHRLERITGHVRYDHLTREATIVRLAGRVLEHDVSAQGLVLAASPPLLDLAVKTDGDLAALRPLLPEGHAVESAKGHARIQVVLDGPATRPAWKGQADVAEATIVLRGMADALEGVQGTITFSQEEVRASDLRLHVRDIAMRVDASLTDFRTVPRLTGTVAFPQGSFTLDSRFRADAVDVIQAVLTMERSRVRLTGRLGRANDPSELQVTGVVELADLTRLPLVNLVTLEPWALQGPVTVQGKLRSAAGRWQDVEMLGSAGAKHVMVRGIPAQDLSLQWRQRSGVLMVTLVQATVGGGRLSGTWFAELHSDPVKLVADADITNLDLGRMTATIPAWHARNIRGTASAHAEISGSVRDQAGWRGTGWFNLSGEHLGEVPLLDRLFHGVFGALADRLGLMDLRRAELTKVSGQWRLAQGRIVTDNTQLSGSAGTEPLTVMIRGSVGLNKTLDLTVEPNLSEQLVLAAPNTSSLGRTILRVMGGAERMRQLVGRHHIGGTLEKPEYKFEFSLEQLLNQVLPAGLGQLLEGVR